MKLSLPVKFILSYILLALAGFCLINTVGARMFGKYQMSRVCTELYEEAISLSRSDTISYYRPRDDMENTYFILHTLAEVQGNDILIVDIRGHVILDTAVEPDTDTTEALEDFTPTAMGNSYYTTGTFFGHFSSEHVSVMAPITLGMSTRGYVTIHKPMSDVLAGRERLLSVTLILYGMILVLFLLLLFLSYRTVYRPLNKITYGAREFAAGNLDYQIPVHSEDEMGYLATTLNYMAGELKQTETFQKNFISNVSHDFRSPLTSIKGYVEAILDGTIPAEMQNKYLDTVLFETSRLTKLTQGMLQLNTFDMKTYMLNIMDFDLHTVIKKTAASFEGICTQRHIAIELLLASQRAFVSADMEKIQQVLYNLIDNAIKFSDDHSVITIETTLKNDKIFISVRDRGSGIPKDSLPKIWDRFYKIDASRGKDRKGTGLGLSIVKEIIATHRQNINVVSNEGVGSEFTFTLARSKKEREDDEE